MRYLAKQWIDIIILDHEKHCKTMDKYNQTGPYLAKQWIDIIKLAHEKPCTREKVNSLIMV